MIKADRIDVYINNKHVGTMAETNYRAAFQYSDEWIDTGFSISPFSLPLEKKLFIPQYNPFQGVYGVFADSLPDGWGRLIVDRYIRRKFNVSADDIDSFQRLTMVCDSGMGALEYRPAISFHDENLIGGYDELAMECKRLLVEDSVTNLDMLFKLGGSSGGARPKIHTKINGEDWIIKFPAAYDNKDIGLQEYEYSLCAKECGIRMSETKLFDSQICAGYFGTKRFDRKADGEKVHMVSAGGLLESSHRYPNLDYSDLMKLTQILTQDMQQVKHMFDVMCFNVYAHNRDDHSKNFSFIYLEDERRWVVSPAYDLTYSSSQGGEHATTVYGEGRNPGLKKILQVAKKAGIDTRYAKSRAEEIEEIVNARLADMLQT